MLKILLAAHCLRRRYRSYTFPSGPLTQVVHTLGKKHVSIYGPEPLMCVVGTGRYGSAHVSMIDNIHVVCVYFNTLYIIIFFNVTRYII